MNMGIDKPLPPGNFGLPGLGETGAFLKNSFAFVEARLAKYGPVFKSSLVGRKAVVICGSEATSRFIDPHLMERSGSMPPHMQALFGGKSLPLLDGEAHLSRKKLVLSGFTRAALRDYLPGMQAVMQRYLTDWRQAGTLPLLSELKKLAFDVICGVALGLQRGPELDGLRAQYEQVVAGFAGVPLNLPGTRFNRALKAKQHILKYWSHAVAEHRRAPTNDALSRILASTVDGKQLSDEQAALELHHIILAGFIVWAELVSLVRELALNPTVYERLHAEVQEQAATGPIALETVFAMPWLKQVIMETKRVTPILPAVFAIAKQDFELNGVKIPQGWMVLWALRATHMDPNVYPNPERFDPERFSKERAEHERSAHAFVPQGAGPETGHRCPAVDFATVMMSCFAILLVRGEKWHLRNQDLDYNWKKLPPEPKSGLLAQFSR